MAQDTNIGKAVPKWAVDNVPVKPGHLKGIDLLVTPPGHTDLTGTTDGPVGAMVGRDTIFVASSPCNDADTVHVGGRYDTVVVPNLVGMPQNDAHILLGKHQLFHRSREVPVNRTTGVVFAQAPPPGTRVAVGTWLKLCWAGPSEVPDVVHLTRAQAVRRLELAGYRPVEQKAAILKQVLVGRVTTQDPPAHARADSGATVTISIGVLVAEKAPSPTPGPPAAKKPPPEPWLWKVLAALTGTAAAAGLAHEIRTRLRIRSIQLVLVRDLGSPTLTPEQPDAEAELRELGLELRPIMDAGTQRSRLESSVAGKEPTGV